MKVHIEYGWPEGKWHSRLLTKTLLDSGYDLTSSAQSADIIIAHSAGCYIIPPDNNAKVILLVGLPNWPDKSIYKCTLQKIKLEPKNTDWFTKTLFHIVYALRVTTNLRTWKALKQKCINVGSATKIILIRNQLDTYTHDKASQSMATTRNWSYRKIPGQHDDIWENPQQYVDIIAQATNSIWPNTYFGSSTN